MLPLVGSFDVDKSGVNSVYGLLRRGFDCHIVLQRSNNYPNNQSRIGFIGTGGMTMALQESQNVREATKQGVSVAEIVRQKLAS